MRTFRLRFLLLPLLLVLTAVWVRSAQAAGVRFLRGDVNSDGDHDVADPVALLLHLFATDQVSIATPLDALDVNDDGRIDVSDAIYELDFLFAGGLQPPTPFPELGFDSSPDDPFLEGDPIATDPVNSGPDLVAKTAFLDDQNFLHFTIANEGRERLPINAGAVKVLVDGLLLRDYALSEITDASFREPSSTQTIETGIRLSGTHRRVAVHVDPNGEISESNELQNTWTRSLSASSIAGPDLRISDIDTGPNMALEVVVENFGTEASPSDLETRIVTRVQGHDSADEENFTFEVTLPSLAAAGGRTRIVLDPALVIANRTRVQAELSTHSLADEIDNSNNVVQRTLPDGADLSPYRALLSESVAAQILWQDASGVHAYPEWSEEQKSDLDTAILSIENDGQENSRQPPALLNSRTISSEDAWQIYLAHIAQSLWVEIRGITEWTIEDLPPEHISYLLDSRKLLTYASATTYRFDTTRMGSVTAWSPRIAFEFLSGLGMLRPTQLETIHALTDWMRGHLIHTSTADVFTEQFGYAGHPPVDRVLYPLDGKRHKTAGCWGTTGLYAAVLRSVNIPVRSLRMQLLCCSHSRPEFPTVDRSMPHGDNPYSTLLISSGAAIPSSELLYSAAEMVELFESPEIDCRDGDCNTIGEQASHNMGRDLRRIAFEYRGDFLLYQFARFGASHVNDTLRGERIGGGVVEFAQPLFDEAQREEMVNAVEASLIEIGDGDLELGKNIVIARYSRYGGNK